MIEHVNQNEKILFVSNLAGKHLTNFSLSSASAARKLNIDFFYAANLSNMVNKEKDEEQHGVKVRHINFSRNLLNINQHLVSYNELKKLIITENIQCIHCNTPIAGAIARLAGKSCKVKKIVYEVHGFHFYKGNGRFKNLLFRAIERQLAKITEYLITMNEEDYQAGKENIWPENVYKIHGVGIDLPKKLAGIAHSIEDTFVCTMVGELTEDKNQAFLLKVFSKLDTTDFKLILCGQGPEENELRTTIQNNNLSNVNLLGYRDDIPEILKRSDCFIFPSNREGLPRAIMEAMAEGLPVITANTRGCIDLIDNNKGGYIIENLNVESYCEAITTLKKDKTLRKKMAKYNIEKVRDYSFENVTNEMIAIYSEVFKMKKN